MLQAPVWSEEKINYPGLPLPFIFRNSGNGNVQMEYDGQNIKLFQLPRIDLPRKPYFCLLVDLFAKGYQRGSIDGRNGIREEFNNLLRFE